MIKLNAVVDLAKQNPKQLFLVDACGAILSAILLGLVLVQLTGVFGIPSSTLYFLAVFPCLFALYDLYCFLKAPIRTGTFLKGIAIMNLSYIFLSIGVAIYHYKNLTIAGWTYISIEIFIVFVLAIVEYEVGKRLTMNSRPNSK
jgi:CDP-diglyceride synthetase